MVHSPDGMNWVVTVVFSALVVGRLELALYQLGIVVSRRTTGSLFVRCVMIAMVCSHAHLKRRWL